MQTGENEMIIEKLSSLTIKVTVAQKDMIAYGLDFDSLSENNSNTENLLRYILREISRHLGINLFNESLYIEAFSYTEHSCILYISVTESYINEQLIKNKTPEKTVLESLNSNDLILFSKDFMKYYEEYCFDSSLYYKNNIFRMIIETNSKKAESIADCALSHGLRRLHGNINAAETAEYFDCIIKNSAAEKLSGQMSF